MRKYPSCSSFQQTFVIKDNKYLIDEKKNLINILPAKKKEMQIKMLKHAAGTPNKSRVTGNNFMMPQWHRSDQTDSIDPSAVKFEIDKQGKYEVPMLCSSVNFKNMETRLNAWTLDS